jgi:hypothetical protein
MSWLTDNWHWWVWILFTACWLGGCEYVLWKKGKRLLSHMVWDSTKLYPWLVPMVFTPIIILSVHFWIDKSRSGWWLGIVLAVVMWACFAGWWLYRRGVSDMGLFGYTKKEPAMVFGVSAAVIAAALVPLLKLIPGVEIDSAALEGFITVVVVIVGAIMTRQRVASIAKIERMEDQGMLRVGTTEQITQQKMPEQLPPAA